MEKEMKNLLVLAVFGIFLFLVLSVNFVFGSFQLASGNESYNIDLIYGPSKIIKGWINISLENEPVDSLISSNLEGSIKLVDFLNENSAEYECTPADCGDDYTSSNGEDSKSFSLGYEEEKIVSFFIEGTISSISNLEFNVSVSNSPSCLNPLEIDILNDDIIEWKSTKFLNDYSCVYEAGTGCFDSSETLQDMEISHTPYCEKINLIESGKFKLGAWVKKGSTDWYSGLLEMWLYDLDGFSLGSCDLPEPSADGGKISCIVEYDNYNIQEYYVCIKADDEDVTGYKTKREDVDACGFYAFPYDKTDETEYHDYYIFAKSAKFDNIGEFRFDEYIYEDQGGSDLNQYILDYIDTRYNKQCSNGCNIPIKFKSYVTLNIEISNAKLKYSTGAGPETTNLIYDTSTEKGKINSGFQKLDLEKTGFLVPSGIGSYTFRLKLNDEQILEEYIEVIAVPLIQDIVPHNVPALVEVRFRVLLNITGNLTYAWDFGDGSGEITDINTVKHTYSTLGSYNLSVIVENEFGTSSKTVQINAGSPKEHVNTTIQDYNNKLDDIQSEINKLPGWIKEQISEKINIDDLKSEVGVQENKYEEAFSDEDYIEIMADLLELEIPDSFSISQTISSSQMPPNEGQINLNALEYLGAGDIEGSVENYACSITNWIENNLDIDLESKTYSLYYDGEEEPLYSYVKFVLTPKQDLEEIYFLVNGNLDEIKFKEDYKVKEYTGQTSKTLFNKLMGKLISGWATDSPGENVGAAGIVFSELTGTKTIEFLYPGKISIGDFPIYISPEFKNLELGAELGICNFNKRCEKDLGENYENCRNDCKPLGRTLFWLFILFLAAFVIYIILQEWYKRFYESHLFKNKNYLFNLVNFMNNSFNQGIRRSKIFSNLKDLNWKGEQLNYAWNKLHGKRTGMWEIPIFKWVEKKQVKKELEKRKGLSAQLDIKSDYSQGFGR